MPKRTPSEAWRAIVVAESRRALFVAAIPFAVYAVGACRTAYVGDSGDLLTAIAVLGIPHPSGYPLYVLLAKLWSVVFFFLPLPWSVSLFSAACAAAASGVLYRTARDSGAGPLPAAGAAWLLAFGPSYWAEANIQRVYALNALFLALALLLALRWRRDRRDRDLIACAFVCGLGASNHLEMGVAGIAIGLFVLVTEPAILKRLARRRRLRPRGARRTSPLRLYLPLRARAHPLLDWGHPVTPETSSRSSSGPTSGAAPGSEGRRISRRSLADYGTQPADRVGLDREPGWRSSRSVARAKEGLARSPAPSRHARQRRDDGAPRIAERPLHLASLLHPVLRGAGADGRMGLADALRAIAPASRRSRPRRSSGSRGPRAGARTTAAATRSARTTRGRCSRRCRRERISSPRTTTSSSSSCT